MADIFTIVVKLSYHYLDSISSIFESLFIATDDKQFVSSIFILNTINFISGDIEDFFGKLHYSYRNLNGEF